MKRLFLWSVMCGLMIYVLSCSSSKNTGKSGIVTIIYSGNIGARYDPCGCRIPLGGLARRSTAISDIKSMSENVLVLDTGALVFEKHNLYPPYENTTRMTAHLVTEMMNRIGIDAVNVSKIDLASGPDTLLAISKESSWPWLSANIVWKDSGNLLFTPDIIKTAGNFNVGIFGLMDQTSMGIPLLNERDPITVLDPAETARPRLSARVLASDGAVEVLLQVPDGYHITDLKNGFFAVAVVANGFLALDRAVFPAGVP
ncbi:hypothetical protein LLG96_11420, partial [bacterium]|nr:hypothetical protein [bacterium]